MHLNHENSVCKNETLCSNRFGGQQIPGLIQLLKAIAEDLDGSALGFRLDAVPLR